MWLFLVKQISAADVGLKWLRVLYYKNQKSGIHGRTVVNKI